MPNSSEMPPSELEPAKTVEEQRREFVEKFLERESRIVASFDSTSDEKTRQLIAEIGKSATRLFEMEQARNLFILSERETRLLAQAENPYFLTDMPQEERAEVYRLKMRLKGVRYR